MRLAVRIGSLTFLVALVIGAVMIAQGVTEPARSLRPPPTPQPSGSSPATPPMYGILVLPALAWLLSFTAWPESRRTRIVALACLGYLLSAGVVVS